MAKKAVKTVPRTNADHLVLSTDGPHPPFLQEVYGQPGVVERCEWYNDTNGYICKIVPNPHESEENT